jgi:hypothetical protein
MFWFILAAAAATAGPPSQAPAGYATIYDAPTKVKLANKPVVADIKLFTDKAAAQKGDLKLVLTTDVTKFIAETEHDLANWVADHNDPCGERWKAGKPYIGFPKDAIRFAIDIEVEYWQCGFDGKGKPGRLAQEAGHVDVTLIPYVESGKLQAKLGDFSIDGRSGVTKYLPLEFVVRRMIGGELKKLNENPKFYRAPHPFVDEGFSYVSLSGVKGSDNHVVITARYAAKGKPAAFDRIAVRLKKEGVTQ